MNFVVFLQIREQCNFCSEEVKMTDIIFSLSNNSKGYLDNFSFSSLFSFIKSTIIFSESVLIWFFFCSLWSSASNSLFLAFSLINSLSISFIFIFKFSISFFNLSFLFLKSEFFSSIFSVYYQKYINYNESLNHIIRK